MIPVYPTDKQKAVISMIDDIINGESVEVNEAVEASIIVKKLAGRPADTSGVISQLIINNGYLTNEIINLRNENTTLRSDIHVLKADLQKLVKIVAQMNIVPYYQDLQELKSKNGIYT